MNPSTVLCAMALLLGASSAGAAEMGLPSGMRVAMPVKSMKDLRFQATLRQQYDFSCGSAALSTLLTHHYGHAVTEQQVFEQMFQRGDRAKIQREGFSLLDMKRYLEAHGYEANGFEAPLDKLVRANIPAIVLINENGYNHFVVVKGVRDERVLIGDPAGGARALRRDAFEAMWVNQIVFVILNRQERSKFNVASDWVTVPGAPIASGMRREGLAGTAFPRLGPSDF